MLRGKVSLGFVLQIKAKEIKMNSDQKGFDESMSTIKQEIDSKVEKSVIVPEYLTGQSKICFRCYPGIGCFTKCCSGIRILLSPYDIYALKKRLGMTYDEFLATHTQQSFIDRASLPITVLKMNNDETRSCPFVTAEGCTVYSDRPLTCRYYPIGMGIMKQFDKGTGTNFFIKIKEDHCLGHNEEKVWTIDEWRADQGSTFYDAINNDWMEVVLKAKTLGMVEFSQKSLALFSMVSSNLDSFRKFVFESKFLDAYKIEPEVIKKIKEDDIELLKFSLSWLRFTLYGEGDFKIDEEARNKAKERVLAEKEKQRIEQTVQQKID
jgi:Fe-S-cluster containining protein